jgi:hypothetical protein
VTTRIAGYSAEAFKSVGDMQVRMDFSAACERVVGVTLSLV